MEQIHSRLRQQGDDAAGMPGHIGHLGGMSMPAKANVQVLGKAQSKAEEVRIHQLGVGGKGQGMPGDIPGRDGLFQFFFLMTGNMLEVFVDQPGPGRPNKPILAGFAHLLCQFDGAGNVQLEITVGDIGSQIGETDIQVGLEDYVNFPDHCTFLH